MAVVQSSGHTMVGRMTRAAKLDVRAYEEVEHDTSATGQAAAVVAIVAIAQGIGAAGLGLSGVLVGIIGALAAWLIWSGVTYLIGDKIFGGTATWGELLRTIGFAQTPGILAIVGFVPVAGPLVRFVAAIWVLIAGIVAIRQALDVSTGKAILTAIVGWLAIAIPVGLLSAAAARW